MNILIIGAGRSSIALIEYTLEKAEELNWNVKVADSNLEIAKKKVKNSPNGDGVFLDVFNVENRNKLIEWADIVVSLLPAHLHIEVARDCIKFKKHFITASYVSKEMMQVMSSVEDEELVFLGEMGLDPGIDHMSAMQKIHQIQNEGGELVSFRSYTGGLIAPEFDTNPWHYKFTWNPLNVVLAGQGTAQYISEGKYNYRPYTRLFNMFETIDVPGKGEYEVYANRDSLIYREIYGINNIPNLIRGTIRSKGFCSSWDAIIKIGLTDNTFPIPDSASLTYAELVEAYVSNFKGETVEEKTADLLEISMDSDIMDKLTWLGLFTDKKITRENGTPAKILLDLLMEKWSLDEGDKDMIIMQHEFEYKLNNVKHRLTSSMVLKGDDDKHTAMAKTVGLPLGIFVKLLAEGKIKNSGAHIPVTPEIYNPVLKELEQYGIEFKEIDVVIDEFVSI